MKDINAILGMVHTRTFYLAERKKKEDSSLAFIQSSEDDKDALMDFLSSAVNEIKGMMVERTLSFSLNIENGIFEVSSGRKKADQIIPLLEKAVEDCIVESILFSWVKDTAPELADYSTLQSKIGEVDKYISMLSPLPRRRPTDLAGI